MDVIKTILEALKLRIWIIFAVAGACCFLLFSPVRCTGHITVDGFVRANRPWIGLTLLVSSCICVVWVFTNRGWVGKRLRWRATRRQRERYLGTLTEEEKRILREYIGRQSKTARLPYDNGVVRGLEATEVIACATAFAEYDRRSGEHLTAYNIQPWAWRCLNAHPKLLE